MYVHFIKRLIDFIIVFCILIIIWPILLSFFIWLHFINKDAGAFFTQERPGKNGKIFRVIKFKTMTDECDKDGNLLPDEKRLTKIGKFIRSTSIDELPQIINVLKGDMSLVGPRPEVRKYVELYTEEQRRVLSVRPGITDYASIEYVDENTILGQAEDADKAYVEQILPDKICYNMKYIEHRSVKEYFKIIFLTIWSIVH